MHVQPPCGAPAGSVTGIMPFWIVNHAIDPAAARSAVVQAKSADQACAVALAKYRSEVDAQHAHEIDMIWPDGSLEASALRLPASGYALWHPGEGEGELELPEGADEKDLSSPASSLWLALSWENEDELPDLLIAANDEDEARSIARGAFAKGEWSTVRELAADPGDVDELPYLS